MGNRRVPWIRLSPCFTSSRSTKRNEKSRTVHDIPDDVLVEIFSRLPIENVINCRAVCKRWSVLTSSSRFTELYSRRQRPPAPVLLVQNTTLQSPFRESSIIVLDDHVTKRKVVKPRTGSLDQLIGNDKTILLGSSDGLLVFGLGPYVFFYDFLVCNLVTRERVVLKRPNWAASLFQWCGMLYGSQAREHILVFWQKRSESWDFEYITCGISSKSWKKVSKFDKSPRERTDSVIINGRLHWMAQDYFMGPRHQCERSIISCNMDIRDFRCMPHPATGRYCVGLDPWDMQQTNMYLSLMEGVLSFGFFNSRDFTISVWMLDDYDNWCWVRKFWVDIRSSVKHNRPSYAVYHVTSMTIENGELIFYWIGQGLFGHHLRTRISRRLEVPKLYKNKEWPYKKESDTHFHHCKVVSYTKSFNPIEMRQVS